MPALFVDSHRADSGDSLHRLGRSEKRNWWLLCDIYFHKRFLMDVSSGVAVRQVRPQMEEREKEREKTAETRGELS